jgi:hypothetical protein
MQPISQAACHALFRRWSRTPSPHRAGARRPDSHFFVSEMYRDDRRARTTIIERRDAMRDRTVEPRRRTRAARMCERVFQT